MLRRVTNRRETKSAVDTYRRKFRSAGREIETKIGFPSGAIDETVYWVEEAGVWIGWHAPWQARRYWTAFGVEDPRQARTVSITVEINPPVEGLNRRVAGFVATDGSRRFLCHSGKVGGGQPGVGKSAFLAWRGVPTVMIRDPDGTESEGVIVACIDDDAMVAQVADFVKLVAAFKAGGEPPSGVLEPAPGTAVLRPGVSQGGDAGFIEEFAGEKEVPARDGVTAMVTHGLIVNRLAEELRALNLVPHRNMARDLFLGNAEAPQVHFEVKTSADPQSIYTGIGQLVYHNSDSPGTRRVLLLPAGFRPQLRERLEQIGLTVMTYTWSGQRPVFASLAALVAGS